MIAPGATAFTRILGASARASVTTRLLSAAFDAQYGIYGTYFNRNLAQQAGPGCGGKNNDSACANPGGTGGGPDPSLNGLVYSDNNSRTITPAIPFAAYGGVRVKF